MADQDDDWFPSTRAGVRAMMQNVLAKIASYQAALGLTAGQVTNIEMLATNYLAADDWYEANDATGQAATAWRNLLFNGKSPGVSLLIGDAMPAAPVFTNLGAIVATVGIIPQFKAVRRNLVTLPGWTQAIGEDLTLVKTSSGGPSPEANTFPELTITVLPGYKVRVKASLKGNDQLRIEYKPIGGAYNPIGYPTTTPADLTVTPQTPGQPESGHLRAICLKKNVEVGVYSPEFPVTLAP